MRQMLLHCRPMVSHLLVVKCLKVSTDIKNSHKSEWMDSSLATALDTMSLSSAQSNRHKPATL
eukprot:2024753-Lingulodinium_polyedra.AAC.1